MKCQKCGEETFLPFRCPYCEGYFCSEHRLPENHECTRIELARAPKKEDYSPKTAKASKPLEYTVTYIPVSARRKFYFSQKELRHLTVAALVVLALGFSLGLSPQTYARIGGFSMLIVFSVGVTSSFLLHELAHKFAAQIEGLWAEFRLIFLGLLLTAISFFSPFFKVISPGAVVIAGLTGRRSAGKISIAGPLTNIFLSIVFLASWFFTQQYILISIAAFNAWIALFNLIPFGILDGLKVFLWSKITWGLTFTLSLALTIITLIIWA